MSARTKHLRRAQTAYILPSVLMFLALAFGAWVLMFHSSGTLIRVEQARSQRQTRSAWSAPAMGAALRLMESGNPPADDYQCKLSVTQSGTTKYFVATFTKQTGTQWTVNVTPTDSNSAYPTAPHTFAALPDAPGGLIASASNSSQVSLSWNDVIHDIGYSVERSLTGASGWSQVGTTAKNVIVLSDNVPSANTTYYYRVRALGVAGWGDYSDTANITTNNVPAAPTNLAATVLDSSSIQLTWTDNSNNETSFKIQESTNGSSWSTVTFTSANATSYTVTGLQSEQTYYFRVRASSSTSKSSYTSAVVATTN